MITNIATKLINNVQFKVSIYVTKLIHLIYIYTFDYLIYILKHCISKVVKKIFFCLDIPLGKRVKCLYFRSPFTQQYSVVIVWAYFWVHHYTQRNLVKMPSGRSARKTKVTCHYRETGNMKDEHSKGLPF